MTPRKERALACLLTARTKEEAAQAAGISPRTLRGYFTDPEFMERYNAAFREVLENATHDAQKSASPAISVLVGIMADEDVPVGVRVQSAKILLENALRFTDQLDVLKRLAELEKTVEEIEGEE